MSHRGNWLGPKTGRRLCVDGLKLKKLTISNQPAGWGAAAAHLHNSLFGPGNLMQLLWIFMERIKYLMLAFLKYSCPMLNSTHTGINPRQLHVPSFSHSKLMATTFYICTLSSSVPYRRAAHSSAASRWRSASIKCPLAGLIDAQPARHSVNTPGGIERLHAFNHVWKYSGGEWNRVVCSLFFPTHTRIQQASNVKLLWAKFPAVN